MLTWLRYLHRRGSSELRTPCLSAFLFEGSPLRLYTMDRGVCLRLSYLLCLKGEHGV